MDFLDSLDLDTKLNKSCRVRSWYLYEQFKSLETHQLDAAQRLKNKSYQDRILRQELCERRARRKLYDQFGLCHSESRIIRKTMNKDIGHFTVSNDDIFERYSEHDYEGNARENDSTGTGFSRDSSPNKINKHDYKNIGDEGISDSTKFTGDFESIDREDNVSMNKFHLGDFIRIEEKQNPSSVNVSVIGDYKSTQEIDISDNRSRGDDLNNGEEHKKKNSGPDSVINIVDNITTEEQCGDYEYSNENQITSMIIAQDLNKQLESAQQNINNLTNITRLEDDNDNLWENISEYSSDSCKIKNKLCDSKGECGRMIAIWSRLVSFAYQLVQLNHGNCYSDYSCQFLTAVLACDVLRRGVNRMCNILQPYVSPVKFTDDEYDASGCSIKNVQRKKLVQSKKSRKTSKTKISRRTRHFYKSQNSIKHCSERCWLYSHRYSLNNLTNCKCRHTNEPWCSFANDPIQEMISTSASTLWPHISRDNMSKNCSCNSKAVNSMLQIACYIDNVLKDINNCEYLGTCENCG